MPLMPPGNALFYSYFDANGKLQSKYIGPAPLDCGSCGQHTYQTASGFCAWCQRPLTPNGR